MSGLILNNYYSIRKSARSSILLACAALIILVLTKEPVALRAALFLPFLLIPVQAFEVLKTDALSGWDTFEVTLPVTRRQIVASKYAIFICFVAVSVLLIGTVFFLTHMFYYPVIDATFFNFGLRGFGIVCCLAASTFPLTFKLGTEKSDSIMMISIGFAFALFFGLLLILSMILTNTSHFDEIFSMIFVGVALVCLLVSYIVSIFIYERKEF